jgi:hypothetical protein
LPLVHAGVLGGQGPTAMKGLSNNVPVGGHPGAAPVATAVLCPAGILATISDGDKFSELKLPIQRSLV